MDVVIKQPTEKQEPPPSYGEQPQVSTGGLPPGYNTVYSQQPGAPAPHGSQVPHGQQMMWMPIPTNVSNCPPGLEYLTAIDQLIVDQQVELIEALTNIECANKYKIVNSQNQQVYMATEESELCERICCKNGRGFMMHIWDNYGREVIKVTRPFQFCAGCCWCADNNCCSLYIEIEAPVGQVVGRVQQTKSCMAAHYDVQNSNGDIVLKIRGPTCVLDGPCCTGDQDFNIFTPDLQQNIGKISKKWSGFVREMFTNADKFGMSFPLDLDIKTKATLFGALFLIDFMFFEYNSQ